MASVKRLWDNQNYKNYCKNKKIYCMFYFTDASHGPKGIYVPVINGQISGIQINLHIGIK